MKRQNVIERNIWNILKSVDITLYHDARYVVSTGAEKNIIDKRPIVDLSYLIVHRTLVITVVISTCATCARYKTH